MSSGVIRRDANTNVHIYSETCINLRECHVFQTPKILSNNIKLIILSIISTVILTNIILKITYKTVLKSKAIIYYCPRLVYFKE